jgi:hypothetical protein
MSLSAYALTTLAAASDCIGGTPKINGIWIYASSPVSATAATVEISDTVMTLIITGGTSAGTKTFDLTAAAYDTLSELIAGINAYALPAGPSPAAVYPWKAGVIANGASASTDLIVTGAQSCLGSANELTLQIADNYRLTELINRSSDLIERWASRKLLSRTYDRRVFDGNGRERFMLDQYPVTRVGRVSMGRTNCFYITNTTAKNFATVEVNATKVRLNADGAVTDITIATYATLTLLIAAINATAGWTATLCNSADGTKAAYYTSLDGTTKVPEILQMPAHACKSPGLAYVEQPDDDIEGYYLETTGADEDRNSGMLYYYGGFTSGKQNLIVDYQAGYSTTPAALEDLCLALIKLKYDRAKLDANMRSESLGDYSYSTADLKQVSADLLNEASFFRAITL